MPAAETPLTAELTPAIDRWKNGIDNGDSTLIASAFTPDSLFQGGWPDPLFGREGVREYYDGQPAPLRVDYQIADLRPLGEDAAVVFLDATFHPEGKDDRPTHITLAMTRADEEWLISHYHVSFIS